MTFNADHLKGQYFSGTEDDFILDWSMSRAERFTLIYFLQKIKPGITIEIGTYNGGSLQVISKYSGHVYAIDNDPSVEKKLNDHFTNVTFNIGDSKEIVPKLAETLSHQQLHPEFVLIDGDHSTQGVYTDLTNILSIRPVKDCYVFLHDTFNPDCRKGIKNYNFSENPYVHYVDLDFVPGEMIKGKMWGGLGLVILKNQKRTESLTVLETYKSKFKRNYYVSIHLLKKTIGFIKPLKKVFK